MVAYLDSSVVLRHILLGEISIKHALAFPRVVSSELLEIECRRTINRCRLQNGLDDAGVVEAFQRLEELLSMTDLIELDSTIKRRAMESFPVLVKTTAALHLASALALAASAETAGIQVFSHDLAMNRCARALGFGTPLAG